MLMLVKLINKHQENIAAQAAYRAAESIRVSQFRSKMLTLGNIMRANNMLNLPFDFMDLSYELSTSSRADQPAQIYNRGYCRSFNEDSFPETANAIADYLLAEMKA